jgi:hypothetical protein
MRVLVVLVCLASPANAAPIVWKTLQPGVEYATLDTLRVVRIDPSNAKLTFALASEHDRQPHTAADWCKRGKLAVAINAGMFKDDGVANVGHLVDGEHVNDARWVSSYKSALAFGPRDGKRSPATMVDLDDAAAQARLGEYGAVVQNLRLIRADGAHGRSVWTEQPRKWSEAAIAFDDRDRVLFLFSRAPHTMADFNRLVLGLPLGVVRAMHVEGGPEASLSIHAGGVDEDWFGSYETGFRESDDNDRAWPIPNVLGVTAP